MKVTEDPMYKSCVAGEIQRVDERDIVFARKDLFRYFGEDSEQFRTYYRDHPEHLQFDNKVSKLKPLGANHPMDAPMFEAQFALIDELGKEEMVDGNPASRMQNLSAEDASIKVKATARMYGADLVKIGPLRSEWTYSHIGCTLGNRSGYSTWGAPINLNRHNHAIAMGFSMDLGLLASAPHFPTLLATAQAYAMSSWTANRLALYIRMMGYSARAHHFSNY